MLATTFWEKNPLVVSVLTVDGVCPPAGVSVVSQLLVSRWSLNCVSRLGGTLAVRP